MNLTEFLHQADAQAAALTREQLLQFVHETGRALPGQEREEFLERLKSAGRGSSDVPSVDSLTMNEMYRLVRSDLRKIDSQEMSIIADLNPDYPEKSREYFVYKDTEGISDLISHACAFLHTCVSVGQYKKGFKIGRQLFNMEILCISVYEDMDLLLYELEENGVFHDDMRTVALDTAYCVCQCFPLPRRSEELFDLFHRFHQNISLESVLQHGKVELTDTREFLPLWIACLKTHPGSERDRLLQEARDLAGARRKAYR